MPTSSSRLVYPPATRLTVNNPSRHCVKTCDRFARRDHGRAGCPGVSAGRTDSRPLCHSAERRAFDRLVERTVAI